MLDDRTGAALRDAFDHVLVDEYQDVNALQVDMLRALRPRDERLTVVGDDAQAVYGFRGADARHILAFPAVFAGSDTVVLEQQLPVGPAYARSRERRGRAGARGLHRGAAGSARRTAGDGPPVLWRCRDEDEQSRAVCERVLALREEGVPCRSRPCSSERRTTADLLELELARRASPTSSTAGCASSRRPTSRTCSRRSGSLDNPRDELAWFRLLQLLHGVGPATARGGR